MPELNYTTAAIFAASVPERLLGKLSNDTDGAFDVNSTVLEEKLEEAERMTNAKLSVRDDIPIPAINTDIAEGQDGRVPPEVRQQVHRIALYLLYERRSIVVESVQQGFDLAMTFLNDVATRKANIIISTSDTETVTSTSETPLIEGDVENNFDDFQFG